MSSSDDGDTLQQTLQTAIDLVEELPSATPSQVASPATLRANRDLIVQLQERMIHAGQLQPLSIRDELENVSLHLGGLAPEPLPSPIRESAETAMASIKRVIRKRVSEEDLDDFFEELDTAVDGISTPTSSQPRDPEIFERSKQAFDDLGAEMRRKKLLAPRAPRKPNKNKVRAYVSIYGALLIISCSVRHFIPTRPQNRRSLPPRSLVKIPPRRQVYLVFFMGWMLITHFRKSTKRNFKSFVGKWARSIPLM